ncbi:hypothetical protein N7492_009385 [Penicillium capsulatum]|uniref:D-xylose 1-dehydrogenase (NADP(+), D-xylono-1,5-lactone-forming) n=1 Tax=Penicillium capsulatum TaxID=69766 RepID=A0A9W9LI18_9EURO|nr:hypothetical protein N7492_009385 [Penicillium capsulatum]
MALAIQAAGLLHQYIWSWLHPTPSKRPDALKLGVIAESYLDPATIIHPANSHPSLILHAISTPTKHCADSLRSQYHFAVAYGAHHDLIDDAALDAIFVSAPIGLRYALVKKCLERGKHVLCESPVAANAAEVQELVRSAAEKSLVLLDGVHWHFHPATHAWRKIVDDQEYGRIIRTDASGMKLTVTGGSTISLLSALGATRFALHATTPSTLLSVTARLSQTDPRVDAALYAHLILEDPHNNPVNCRVYTDLARPWAVGVVPRVWEVPMIQVETEKAVISYYNFLEPHLYHTIEVEDKSTGETAYRKRYQGGPLWGKVIVSTGEEGGVGGWSSYRWQLEAFVDAVQGRTPAYWVAPRESVWMMESVDAVYRAAELPVRESV